MMLKKKAFWLLVVGMIAGGGFVLAEEKASDGVMVDQEKKTVTLACKIAPRKLPNLQEVYPIEVIATLAAPNGQKALRNRS